MLKAIIFHTEVHRLAYRIFRWHARYLSSGKVSPLACGFYLTSRCNFQCDFCNIRKVEPAFQMPQDASKQLITQLGKMGLVYFSFSGGEPLLVPYVFDLLAYAKRSGILYTHLVSNGYLMDKAKAEDLKKAGVSEISFSFDGEQKIHDKKRNMPGAFDKVLRAVEFVKTRAPQTKIVLNCILDPFAPQEAVDVVRIAERLNVFLKVQPMNNHPDFGTDEAGVVERRGMTDEERCALLSVLRHLKKADCIINSKPFLNYYEAFVTKKLEGIFSKRHDCIFGYHHLEVFNGEVFPCLEGMQWKNGFKDVSSLKQLFDSGEYKNKLKSLRKCFCCRKNYYVCYYEPRLNFPIWNLIKSRLISSAN